MPFGIELQDRRPSAAQPRARLRRALGAFALAASGLWVLPTPVQAQAPTAARFDTWPSYTQVYEGERKVIVFEVPGVSADFSVSHADGLTAGDYRVYYPHDSATPLTGTTWTATAANGMAKFGLEGVADDESGAADQGESLNLSITMSDGATATADIKIRDGTRPLSLLFRVGRSGEWVETDRPAVTLHEGGGDVSYQFKASGNHPGLESADIVIGPNPDRIRSLDRIKPGPRDRDRFIYRDPVSQPGWYGNLWLEGLGHDDEWRTVTFAAGQDGDAFGHALTMYHRVWLGGANGQLAGPDSRAYSRTERAGSVSAVYTWPLPVRIVDDDKWEQELAYARHDAGVGGPGDWVLGSDAGLRLALPSALKAGDSHTFYIRLAADPATLPKSGTVQRNQRRSYFENGQRRYKQVDVYPPTYQPDRVLVFARVHGLKGALPSQDVFLTVSPSYTASAVPPNTGTYYFTDTSGVRDHPSVEADYDYKDNINPHERAAGLLLWDEPITVTVHVNPSAQVGEALLIDVRTQSYPGAILQRPGARNWSRLDGRVAQPGWEYRGGHAVDVAAETIAAARGPASPPEFHGDDAPPVVPVVSVTAGAGVTEGAAAAFTVSASPAPLQPLEVGVTVGQAGDFGASTGARKVTIGTSGTATVTVATVDDGVDEADGSVTATVADGSGYAASSLRGSASVPVADDDDPLPVPCAAALSGSGTVRSRWDSSCVSVARSGRFARFFGFSLASQASVTIDLESAEDTYLYLRRGRDQRSGSEVARNDDGGEGYNSRIAMTLGAGDYTIEATTYWTNRSGTFSLATAGVPDQTATSTPQISITADGDVVEGGDASFTVSASPAPSVPLSVDVTVAQVGDFGAATGSRTVTVPTGGSVSVTVGTSDDDADEPDGSVTATVAGGEGYAVSAAQGTASVVVADDDDPPAEGGSGDGEVPAGCGSADALAAQARANHDALANTASNRKQRNDWWRAWIALSGATGTYNTPLTAAEARVLESGDARWAPFRAALECLEGAPPPPPVVPEVSVTGGAGITEGGDASFTVSASPAPSAPLSVGLTVAQVGDFGVSAGSRTVTVPVSGTATATVSTSDDSADEADGSVAVTVDTGDGYTIASAQGSASVSVSDDDDPPPVAPEVSVTAGGGVTEGGDVPFTVTASPAPSVPLSVNVTVAQVGDYGATTGSRTVMIPVSGTATVTVGTSDDDADEPDGSVTVTVASGDGYTVSPAHRSATVNVSDDDDPPPPDLPPPDLPQVSVADSSVAEGELGWLSPLEFRLALSEPSDQNIVVHYRVRLGTTSPSDHYGGSRRATIWAGRTQASIVIMVVDDTRREGEETLEIELTGADGAVIDTDAATATGTIIDND